MPSADAPDWFTRAIAERPASHRVDVDGCEIHYLSWGDPGRPGIVLLHGGAAHARWWSHLAPLLAGPVPNHVVALDLSGHGDSGWRDRYDLAGWADEVVAVAEHAGMGAPPVVIGHSMGGFVAIGAAARHGDRLAGAIVVDSPVRQPDPESEEGHGGQMFRAPKVYPDLETAIGHFHLVPPQPDPAAFVLDHVARHSLREADDGWHWKFDPQLFQKRERRQPGDYGRELALVRCRLAVLHGELSSIVDVTITEYMAERLGRTAPFVEIPQAHHHLILDQPLAFVAAVRALLADWEHSQPLRIPGLP